MQRVTEPELMIDPDQVLAYAETDFSISEERMISELSDFVKDSEIDIEEDSLIIDLGCGPGNITERLSLKWPAAKIIGIDDSIEMLRLARKKQENVLPLNKFTSNISYEKFNISSISKGNTRFVNCADLVVSNSLLHHIHDINLFFDALIRVSKKGSIHYHRDLRRPVNIKELYALQRKYLPCANSIVIRDFVASLKAAYTVDEIREYLKSSNLDWFEIKEIGDRYIDITGVYP